MLYVKICNDFQISTQYLQNNIKNLIKYIYVIVKKSNLLYNIIGNKITRQGSWLYV